MKSKLIRTLLLLILALTAPLLCQDNWSNARQLSRDGVGPHLFMGVPAITVDSSGTIHAFWIISPSEDGSVSNRYSQIEYRRSSDGGKTWSATENLTPEYTTQRIYYMKAACDSENNVHVVYMRGSEGKQVLHKMYNGETWTEPLQIGSGTVYLRMTADADSRVYALWMSGHKVLYSYLDINSGNTLWQQPEFLSEDDFGIDFLTVDKNNNIYGTGSAILWHAYYTYRPYMFKYTKELESWTVIEEIGNFDKKCLAGAVAVSDKDSIYANVALGESTDNNTDNHLNKHYNSMDWSKPYSYGTNNNWDREMYIDTHDYLHLFELHFFEGTVNGPMGLTHSVGKNRVWETVVIDSSYSQYSYSEPNAAFDKINNKFYLLYNQSDKLNSTNRIYFRSKLNTTSIENSDDIIAQGYQLYQNYPNPFNNSTKISYSISKPANVKLSVFNLKGELVRQLVNARQSKGQHSVIFNADDLNSGIYFYRLEVNGIEAENRKMLYLK